MSDLSSSCPTLRARLSQQAGQTTAEYALVILGAAAVAAMLISWAARSDAIGRLFDAVLERVLGSTS